MAASTTKGDPDGHGRLAGRRILITGAASGIGRATAELFAAEGARTALLDKDGPGLEKVAARTGATPLVVDLRDRSSLPGAVSDAVDALGGLDGLVNVAGVQIGATIDDLSDADFDETFGVNLAGPYFLCRAALDQLRRSPQASIVNVASGAGLLPAGPGSTAYSASKGALIAFSKALAAELAPGVRVNAVCPGIANTPMVSHLLGQYENPDDAPMVQRYALRRVADPAEIAAAILFLTSAEASYVTGSTLAVDGGRTFH